MACLAHRLSGIELGSGDSQIRRIRKFPLSHDVDVAATVHGHETRALEGGVAGVAPVARIAGLPRAGHNCLFPAPCGDPDNLARVGHVEVADRVPQEGGDWLIASGIIRQAEHVSGADAPRA